MLFTEAQLLLTRAMHLPTHKTSLGSSHIRLSTWLTTYDPSIIHVAHHKLFPLYPSKFLPIFVTFVLFSPSQRK
ncbi:hypothetical protein L6452_13394 [Arctium lappa]|uniref:Uncharacterized protein n=1 Tax=Arctium lappa TaxID=4217 RepID=A0ACB9CI69_ARCLA|nr:hypothetical protein L6452_13394 [Arctium lappa]